MPEKNNELSHTLLFALIDATLGEEVSGTVTEQATERHPVKEMGCSTPARVKVPTSHGERASSAND